MLRLCLALEKLLWALPAAAHESRPSYLEITEVEAGQYEVLWKRPPRGDRMLGLSVVWPGRPSAVPNAIWRSDGARRSTLIG